MFLVIALAAFALPIVPTLQVRERTQIVLTDEISLSLPRIPQDRAVRPTGASPRFPTQSVSMPALPPGTTAGPLVPAPGGLLDPGPQLGGLTAGAGRPASKPSPAPGPDCNGNGINDLFEIWQGTTQDCNADGIPDECQLAAEWTYRHDDGIAEGDQGWGTPYYCWLAQHVVQPGQEVITEIEIGRGTIAPETPVTIGLWSDPNGDLDPTDALEIWSVDTTLSWPGSAPAVRIDIPDTFVGPAGASYFVGVLGGFAVTDEPLSADFSTASYKSWLIASNTPIVPEDLAAGALSLGQINNADWVLRAISCPTGHCGELQDTDFDGTPDACQPQDCNGNGTPDDQDIALGFSEDCQGDGIPDECQTDPGLVTYAYDEIFTTNAVGTNHDYQMWLSPHVVQPGGEVVTDVEVAWGYMQAGTEMTVCLWSDPNGDGDPTDAQLILGHPVLSTLEGSGQFVLVNIPDTFVGAAGSTFFLGATGYFDQTPPLPIQYPAPFDESSPDLKAWYVSADAPFDLNDISAGAAEFGRLNTVCACDGDWNIRAITCTTGHCLESVDLNMNLAPDECEPDCNGNFIPDDLDIQSGLETDCNLDGVPDSCQGLADCDGNGLADLCQAVTPAGLAAEYYASDNLSGSPVARIDPQVDYDFTLTPPPPGIPPTGFSARWTGSILTTASGVHGFSLLHEGPARLWVNGVLLVDEWVDAGAGVIDSDNTILLSAGMEYQVRLEFLDTNGDQLQLQWQPPGGSMLPVMPFETRPIYDRNLDGIPDVCQLASDCNGNLVEDLDDIVSGSSLDIDGDMVPDDCQRCEDKDGNGWLDSYEPGAGPGLVGQYFQLHPLTLEFSSRTQTVVDPQVSFDWGTASPVGVPVDRFGARWTGTLTTPPVSGSYAFEVQSDDGARLWIDEVLVIDNWTGSGTSSANVTLDASTSHLVRLDYRETGGTASVELRWTVPGSAKVPVPSSALSPDTDINGDGIPDPADSDCNLNGIPDSLDQDLDGNCVPDDCEGGTGYWRFEGALGQTVPDSTPNGLDGTFGGFSSPEYITDVPVAVVPQTGAPNLQALDNDLTGDVRVTDAGGLLSVPDNSFTLEAWVRLFFVSDTSSANDRKWLFLKKPPSSSDVLLEYGLLVQAGDLGTTGRELLFRYGDGVSVKKVVSSLSVDDTEWHFVSVAYDADRLELRFGVDGVFETLPFEKPAIANVGTLIMAAHENSAGSTNQWLFGVFDEPRFTRAFLPPESLLDHDP